MYRNSALLILNTEFSYLLITLNCCFYYLQYTNFLENFKLASNKPEFPANLLVSIFLTFIAAKESFLCPKKNLNLILLANELKKHLRCFSRLRFYFETEDLLC